MHRCVLSKKGCALLQSAKSAQVDRCLVSVTRTAARRAAELSYHLLRSITIFVACGASLVRQRVRAPRVSATHACSAHPAVPAGQHVVSCHGALSCGVSGDLSGSWKQSVHDVRGVTDSDPLYSNSMRQLPLTETLVCQAGLAQSS